MAPEEMLKTSQKPKFLFFMIAPLCYQPVGSDAIGILMEWEGKRKGLVGMV
jgi:hypothetical protein